MTQLAIVLRKELSPRQQVKEWLHKNPTMEADTVLAKFAQERPGEKLPKRGTISKLRWDIKNNKPSKTKTKKRKTQKMKKARLTDDQIKMLTRAGFTISSPMAKLVKKIQVLLKQQNLQSVQIAPTTVNVTRAVTEEVTL